MVFAEEISVYNGTVALYLAGKSQNLRAPERIFFHLVENREGDYPFAFLATYATKGENDKVRHMPLRLTSEEAYQILRDVPKIEETGIICRIPNWWKKNACSVSMSVNLGEDRPPMVGLETILGMVPQLVVDGVPLMKEEIEELLHQTEGLAFLKGKWIEVDHAKLRKLLDEMENYHGDLTLLEALRMDLNEQQKQGADVGAIVKNGTWLAELLKDLRTPKRIRSAIVPKSFCATLRPYQKSGFTWPNSMIAPFMLRRVKTDKEIISDLPDKLEQVDYVGLSKKQTVLYRKYVAELADKLNELSGIQRRGLVLASLTKLKQICNHPDQYLGQGTFDPKESGKFEMIRDMCETIYEKRERVLVFTQFKEITPYLDEFLSEIFHCHGYVLHGGTPVSKRNQMVEAFQGEKYVPYMILSVKAGGTGLNLTNASHVIHFDRWWNPAVENQATDPTYRIGQKKNVIVHKLVCKGTIEEKINEMIESKKELAANVIGNSGESWITEMSNEELLAILTLD